MGVLIPASLMHRHLQSAIVSELVLVIFDCMREVYQRKRSLNAMLEEMVIACAVRRNDYHGLKPMTALQLAQELGIPRTNVMRAINDLIEIGLLKKDGGGIIGDVEFLQKNEDAPYFHKMLAAIRKACADLDDLGVGDRP